jgi:hypothetical protein
MNISFYEHAINLENEQMKDFMAERQVRRLAFPTVVEIML